jgi:hypothetical protein
MDTRDIRESKLYSYNLWSTQIANFAIFTSTKLKDPLGTYVELETTGKFWGMGEAGIGPYLRMNLVRGEKPTYQAGVSIKPGRLLRKVL